MSNAPASTVNKQNARTATGATRRTRKRALIELAVAYVLILSVIWSPRPLQRVLWVIAVGGVAAIMARSWDGRRAVGLRRENFWRSMWVPAIALAIAATAIVVSIHLHWLRLPGPSPVGIGSADDALGRTMLMVR